MASNAALDLTIAVETQHREVEIRVDRHTKNMTLSINKSMTPWEFEGPYSVVPRLYYGTTLATQGLMMRENVSVSAIPIYDVSNPAGGRTVTIGTV